MLRSLVGSEMCIRDSDRTLWCAMVVDGRKIQRHVLRKMFAAALITLYVISVAQAMNCGADEYYDDVISECRSCRLLCDPVYRTPRQCADKCPAGTEHVYSQLVQKQTDRKLNKNTCT